MFAKEFFSNKKILIYGLGISGNSCLKFLSKKNNVKIFDDNNLLRNKRNKDIFLDKKKLYEQEFDFIVLSPGIDIKKCKLDSEKCINCACFCDDCEYTSDQGCPKCNCYESED